KRHYRILRRVLRRGQRESERKNIVRVESRVGVAYPLIAPNQQSGANQQNQREGYFERHQHTPSPLMAASGRCPSRTAAFVQHLIQSTREARSAGNNPNTTPVTSATRPVNASTRTSTPTSLRRGMFSGPMLRSVLTARTASNNPNAPPDSASSVL